MNEENKVSKEKSSLYPAFTVKETLDFIKNIDKIGGKKVAISLIAETMGVSSSTKSFTRKLSAARQYGFIDNAAGAVALTEFARKILYPTGENERTLLVEAFSKPTLYSKLIERYQDKALPEKNILSNVLIDPEFGIIRNMKDLAADTFFKNCEELDLLKSGILTLSVDDSNVIDSIKNDEINENPEQDDNQTKIVFEKTGYQEITIPLPGKDDVIKIMIPKNSEKEDFEFLKTYIETLLPIYIEKLNK